jgi:tetratricopeptide (TPR) repeat protein
MVADSRAMIADLKVTTGDYAGALAAASDVYRISEESHNPWGQGLSRVTTAMIEWERGDYGGAIRSSEEALRFGNEAKSNYVEGARIVLAMARLAAGDQVTALTELGLGAALTTKIEARVLPPAALFLLAHAAVLRGDVDEARRLRTESPTRDAPRQASAFIALALAEVALASGEYANAAQIAHDELEGAERGRLLILRSDLEWVEGDALLHAGDLPAATAALERARAEAERRGSQRTLWLILWSLARLADAEGRTTDGVDLRRRARAIVDAIAESLASLGLAESFKRTPYASELLAEP